MQITFIYRPRSGDRVFAFRAHPAIAIIGWPCGSRHAAGGVRLTYKASSTGCSYRDEAKSVAATIVAAAGGIAWDDRGTVSLVVPKTKGLAADLYMRACRARFGRRPHCLNQEDLGNEAALIQAGVASLAQLDVVKPYVDESNIGIETFGLTPNGVTDVPLEIASDNRGVYWISEGGENPHCISWKKYIPAIGEEIPPEPENDTYQCCTVDA